MNRMKAHDKVKDRPTYGEACAILGVVFRTSLENEESRVFPGCTKLYSILYFWTTFSIYTVSGNGRMYLPGNEYNNLIRDFPLVKDRLQQMRRATK